MNSEESKTEQEPVSTGVSKANGSANCETISTGNFKAEIGLLNTSLQTLGFLGNKFQHQLLENSDEVLNYLQVRCSPETYQEIAGCFEILMKQPIRRALGRIRCVARSLEEIKRHFAESELVNNSNSSKTR